MIYFTESIRKSIDREMSGVTNWLPVFNIDYQEELLECKFLRMESNVTTKIYSVSFKELNKEKILHLIVNCRDDALTYESKL